MNKRQAKKVVYAYLVKTLDPSNYGEYLSDESNDNEGDYKRLLEAVKEILQELERRAGTED